MNESNNSTSAIRLLILLVGLGLAVQYVGIPASSQTPAPPRESAVKRQVVKVSSDLNKHVPRMVNSELRLDQVSPGPGRTIEFRYTFVNLARSKDADPDRFVKTVRPLMVEYCRKDPGAEPVRKSGMDVNLRFFDKNGIYLADILIGPDDLK